jgi:hypothetical protein
MMFLLLIVLVLFWGSSINHDDRPRLDVPICDNFINRHLDSFIFLIDLRLQSCPFLVSRDLLFSFWVLLITIAQKLFKGV